MKKILLLLLVMTMTITISGCGKKDEVISKTCTIEDTNMTQTYKFTATNDEIDKLDLTIAFDNAMFGVDSLDIFTDEQKEQVKTTMLTTLGLEKDSYEGFVIDVKIDDTMTVTLNADLAKADPEVLNKLGLDLEDADMSLDRAVKDMEDEGATCK